MKTTAWIKASASATDGQCVEMRRNGPAVEVRDSKNPTGPVLQYTPNQFTAWVETAKDGDLDDLL